MKVKTFTGTHRAAVDQQVNDWLARSKVEVRKTSTAFKALDGLGRHFRQNNEPPSGWNCNFGLVRRAGHESDWQ
jgi:hypothetical protein